MKERGKQEPYSKSRKLYKDALRKDLKRLEELANSSIQYKAAIALQEDRLHEMVCKYFHDYKDGFQQFCKQNGCDNLTITKFWSTIKNDPEIQKLSDQVDELYVEQVDRYWQYLEKKILTKDGLLPLESLDLRIISKKEFDQYVETHPETNSFKSTVLDALGLLEQSDTLSKYIEQSMKVISAANKVKDKTVSAVNKYIDQSKKKVVSVASQSKEQSKVKRISRVNGSSEKNRASLKEKTKVLKTKERPRISKTIIENAQIELGNKVSAAIEASGETITKSQIKYCVINHSSFQFLEEAEDYLDGVIIDNNYSYEEEAEFFKAINWKETRKKLVRYQRAIDRKFSVFDKQFIQDGKIVTLRDLDILSLSRTQLNDLIKSVHEMPAVKTRKNNSKNYKNSKYNQLNAEQQALLSRLDELIEKARKVSHGNVTLEDAKRYVFDHYQFINQAEKKIKEFVKLNSYSEQQTEELKKRIGWTKKKRTLKRIQKDIERKFSVCNKEYIQNNQIITLRDHDLWSMSEEQFNRLCAKIKRRPNNIRRKIKSNNDKALYNVYKTGTEILSSPDKMNKKKIEELSIELGKIKMSGELKNLSLNDFTKKVNSFLENDNPSKDKYQSLWYGVERFVKDIDIYHNPRKKKERFKLMTGRVAAVTIGVIATAIVSFVGISTQSQAATKDSKKQKASYSAFIDESILIPKDNVDTIMDNLATVTERETVKVTLATAMQNDKNMKERKDLELKAEKKAEKWACDYYGCSVYDLHKFADSFIETSKVLGIDFTDRMSVYNFLYELSQIPNEEKERVAMERLGLTRAQFDDVVNTALGEAGANYIDGYGTASNMIVRTASERWKRGVGNNIYTQVVERENQYAAAANRDAHFGERNSLRYQGILDALYSGIISHRYGNFEAYWTELYSFQFTYKGNKYGIICDDLDNEIFQEAASYFTEDGYSLKKTLESDQDKAA